LAFRRDLGDLVHDTRDSTREHRDTQAIHAKLDELLRADKSARTELGQIDNEEPEVIEERRAKSRRQSLPLT
jgi:low affinity Fe/Cu permease